ncbi:MAG: VOC family protein [Bacteroidia bacterium]|nr:VOC family protein [Bacteroidia bacterium]
MATKFHPFISFNGTCEKAFNMYKTIFGSDYVKFIRYNDVMHQEGAPQSSAEFGNQIRHIELPLNHDVSLLGCDNAEDSAGLVEGNNLKICIMPEDNEEANRLFEALSEEGEVKVEMQDSSWGSYYGSLIDKFGIHWMIEVPSNETPPSHADNANIHIP